MSRNCQTASFHTKSARLASSVMTVVTAVVLDLLGKLSPTSKSLGNHLTLPSFESRDVCEQVIKELNNTVIAKAGGEEHIMQIRYADTHEQKMLKQQTAAARQFRAAEFEVGCIQAGRNGFLAPPERLQSTSPTTDDAANEFEQFLQQANNA
jgi:hypothetical protein